MHRRLSFTALAAAALGLVAASPPAATAPQPPSPYTFINLGTLGGNFSGADGLNDAGEVVGFDFIAGARMWGLDERPFRWKDANSNHRSDLGEMVHLPTLGGAGQAFAINNAGEAVGVSRLGGTGTPYHAALFNTVAGTVADLNSFLSPADAANWVLERARDINDNRQVVGDGQVTSGGVTETHGYLLDLNSGTLTDLGFFPGALNNLPAPQVVGGSTLFNSAPPLIDLAPLQAFDVNDAGEIVGRAPFSYSSFHRPFYRSAAGVVTDIGTFESFDGLGRAQAINATGLVVGATERRYKGLLRQIAFQWQAGTPTSSKQALQNLVSADITLGAANDVNASATVAGEGWKDVKINGANVRLRRPYVVKRN